MADKSNPPPENRDEGFLSDFRSTYEEIIRRNPPKTEGSREVTAPLPKQTEALRPPVNRAAPQQPAFPVPQREGTVPPVRPPVSPAAPAQGSMRGRTSFSHTQDAPAPQGSAFKPRTQSTAPAPPPPKKRTRKLKKAAALIIVCLTVFCIGIYAIAAAFAGKVQTVPGSSGNPFIHSWELQKALGVTNILLLGVDGSQTDASLRSDTMMLITLDKRHNAIKMTSFLRDSHVDMPGKDYKRKLNTAYTLGEEDENSSGPLYVKQTIEYNFKIKIHHYVQVDYAAFRNLVNALGGINVDTTKAEAKYINKTAPSMKGNFPAGEDSLLTGAQALVYVRIRKLDSDFERTKRQRKVLSAILAKLKEHPFKVFKIAGEVLPQVTTDMTPGQLARLGFSALPCLGYERMSYAVPAEGTWSDGWSNGSAVVKLDIPNNASLLEYFLYDQAPQAAD
ncbi:MAG: LCP family protein [Oscillospiraceae bacterium]|jgi:LCP family protein required for cell wall assembly|nr:LCP family protein [Oscillospiraceae bacterium]